MLPLAAEEVFRPGRVGEALDGAGGAVEPAPDGAAAVAGFQQGVDGGVPGPDAVGEPVALPRRGGCFLERSGIIGFLSGRLGDEDAQSLAVPGDGPLGGLAEVVPQVPPVSDLDRLGCPGRGANARPATELEWVMPEPGPPT